MYDELTKRLMRCRNEAAIITDSELADIAEQAADAIEELSRVHEADAKEIEWLKKCVQDLPKPPRWISVEETPPEPYKGVLLYNGLEIATGYMHSDKRFTLNASHYPNRPTHWIPLPEPPKEET